MAYFAYSNMQNIQHCIILKLVISICVPSLYVLNIFVTVFIDKLALKKQKYGFMNEKYHGNDYFPMNNYVQNVTWYGALKIFRSS